ncbi:hypothetical protein OSTOST_23247 [Ostertagia ostertagi]
MVTIIAALSIIYSLIELAYGNSCSSCKVVVQGAEFALESGEDLTNFVDEQCRYHEILYYTPRQLELCKEIAPKIVANSGIQNKLRQPGSKYMEVCTRDLRLLLVLSSGPVEDWFRLHFLYKELIIVDHKSLSLRLELFMNHSIHGMNPLQ